MTSSPADLPYRLGRAERRGAVLTWRPGQALALALATLALVLGVASGSAAGAALGVAAALGGVAVAAVPVRGRGLDEWVPVALGFLARPRRGAPCAGAGVVEGHGGLAHLRWPDGTATAFARLGWRGLRSLGDEPRELGELVAAWLRAAGGAGARRRTVTLLATTAPGGPAPRDAPFADPGLAATCFVAVTADEPVDVATELVAVGVAAAPVAAGALDALLRDRVAPAHGTLLGCDAVARWHLLEAPCTVHAAFLVDEWPAGDVDEQVLAPLCVSRDRRTVAVHVVVEELSRARERVATQRTAAAADRQLARRGGFLASPAEDRDAGRDAERAEELAAGHGALRVVGVVALDAEDRLGLEAAAARLHADAASVGLRLRRCDGDHRRGVLASVPGWCVP